MKISYFVDVGESFKPPVKGQAPSNLLPDKHRVEWRRYTDGTWQESDRPIWSQNCQYKLEEKPVRVLRYRAVLSTGSGMGVYISRAAVEAMGAPFIIETTLEDGKVIDVKVIKKGE